jgi:hypothetical protein
LILELLKLKDSFFQLGEMNWRSSKLRNATAPLQSGTAGISDLGERDLPRNCDMTKTDG